MSDSEDSLCDWEILSHATNIELVSKLKEELQSKQEELRVLQNQRNQELDNVFDKAIKASCHDVRLRHIEYLKEVCT